MVFVSWIPEDDNNSFQQIVGHYNWEILQYKDRVRFVVGRMNDNTGPFYSLNYFFTEDFFNKSHSALAIYNPGENGYIELFIDGNFAGRVYIGKDRIYSNYGEKTPLGFGKSEHGVAEYFKGCVRGMAYISNVTQFLSNEGSFTSVDNIYLTEIIEVIPITEQAKKTIDGVAVWKA